MRMVAKFCPYASSHGQAEYSYDRGIQEGRLDEEMPGILRKDLVCPLPSG